MTQDSPDKHWQTWEKFLCVCTLVSLFVERGHLVCPEYQFHYLTSSTRGMPGVQPCFIRVVMRKNRGSKDSTSHPWRSVLHPLPHWCWELSLCILFGFHSTTNVTRLCLGQIVKYLLNIFLSNEVKHRYAFFLKISSLMNKSCRKSRMSLQVIGSQDCCWATWLTTALFRTHNPWIGTALSGDRGSGWLQGHNVIQTVQDGCT